MDNPRGGVTMYDDVPIDEPPPVVVSQPILKANDWTEIFQSLIYRVQVPM